MIFIFSSQFIDSCFLGFSSRILIFMNLRFTKSTVHNSINSYKMSSFQKYSLSFFEFRCSLMFLGCKLINILNSVPLSLLSGKAGKNTSKIFFKYQNNFKPGNNLTKTSFRFCHQRFRETFVRQLKIEFLLY